MKKNMAMLMMLTIVFAIMLDTISVWAKNYPAGLSLKKDKITLYLKESGKKTFKAKKLVANLDETMTMSLESDDGSVCTVSNKTGKIRAAGVGTTKVMILIRNKTDEKTIFAKYVKVTVKKCREKVDPKASADVNGKNVKGGNGTDAMLTREDVEESMDYLEKSRHYFTQGYEYYTSGQFGDAILCYKKALEYNTDPDILFCIGYTYMEMGDYDSSLEYYLDAIDFGNEHAINNIIYIVNACISSDTGKCIYYLERLAEHTSSQVVSEELERFWETCGYDTVHRDDGIGSSPDEAPDDGFQEPTEQDLVIEEEDGYCWNEEK